MKTTRSHTNPKFRFQPRAAARAFAVTLVAISVVSPAQAHSFKVLHTFTGTEGANPYAGVVRAADGNLYGTTTAQGQYSWGTVFKLHANGNVTVLHHFTGGSDGGSPEAGLTLGRDGNLFGTAAYGGNPVCFNGCGTVFKLDNRGTFFPLYEFAFGADGAIPIGGLLEGANGDLYGSAALGGDFSCDTNGCGVVFKISKSGAFSPISAFHGADGQLPQTSLLQDASGKLYGTTTLGGNGGWGVVFELDPSSGNENVLHRFSGNGDGGQPWGGLSRDAAGNLYGEAPLGGDLNCSPPTGCGVAFKIDTSGNETVLHRFHAGKRGDSPYGTVIMDTAGNLYGTTGGGGGGSCQFGCGIVYKIDPTGKETVLHTFSGGADGADPSFESLLLDSQGNIYGTTVNGGDPNCDTSGNGCGVVFELTP